MNNENMKLRFFALDHKTHTGLAGCIVEVYLAIRLPATASEKTPDKKKTTAADAAPAPTTALPPIRIASTRTDSCGYGVINLKLSQQEADIPLPRKRLT